MTRALFAKGTGCQHFYCFPAMSVFRPESGNMRPAWNPAP